MSEKEPTYSKAKEQSMQNGTEPNGMNFRGPQRIKRIILRGMVMKKFLYKLMEYRFIYRLMPTWTKFMYCFDIMVKNGTGDLYLGNGYYIDFETMTIGKTEE